MIVTVLMGGMSREREVSLATGRACAAGLMKAGYEVVELDVDRRVAEHFAHLSPNVCFNALHGPLGEDGSIQGMLNILGIPYTHSEVAASALAMDKLRTKAVASALGFATPRGGRIGRRTFEATLPTSPYVLKPVADGSSIDTFVVRDPTKAPFPTGCWPFSADPLLEDLVEGIEVTATVLGDRALTVTEILPRSNFYDYAAKYTGGGSEHILPARLPAATFDLCLERSLAMHRAIGCRGISRSDFIVSASTGEPIFLEINTQPGMTPTSLAPEQAAHVGISFPELMHLLVEAASID